MVREFTLQWQLDELFASPFSPAESNARDFFRLIDSIKQQVQALVKRLDTEEREDLFELWQVLTCHLLEAFSYVGCLGLENPLEPRLIDLHRELIALESQVSDLSVKIEMALMKMPESIFENWVKKRKPIESALLRYRRKHQAWRMSPEKELLAHALSRECFTPMQELYRSYSARLAVHIPDVGTMDVYTAEKALYQGPISNRELVMSAYEGSWKKQASIFASLMNQIYGYRCEMMRQRHQSDLLEPSLVAQKMNRASVDAFWRVIHERKACFILFLTKKALFFKRKKPIWSDIRGSIIQAQRLDLPLKEATEWVLAAVSRMGQEVGDFCRSLIRDKRVYAYAQEVPAGVGPSSMVLPFPLKKQVFVYLNYSCDIDRLTDYARQMITAWRQALFFDTSEGIQQVPTVVSEALNTFIERLTLEVVNERAHARQQQFDALYSHMQRALTQVLESQVHYLFESRVMNERAKGALTSERLNEIMRECQWLTYSGQLSVHFPIYWATKESFFSTAPYAFQTYPLAMGFCLGLAFYQSYLRQPRGFCDKLKEWVKKSVGAVGLETLTQEMFQLDLKDESVWKEAMNLLEQDMRSLGDLLEIKDRAHALESSAFR